MEEQPPQLSFSVAPDSILLPMSDKKPPNKIDDT
jgi:hypothetical protein